jgi:tetratricopeptide (TPR) repeat protein
VISFPIFPEITTGWMIDQFNKALGAKFRDLEEILSKLRQLGSVFIHVDDYELISNSRFSSSSPSKDIRAIHNFLKSMPNNVRLFISSRNTLNDFDLGYNFEISGLNEKDAVDLFLKLIQGKHIGKVDNSLTNEITSIVKEIEGHPLAIKLLSGSYNGGGISELNSIHKNIIDIKNNLEVDIKYRSLKSCFNYSFKRLSINKQELLLQLSTFRSPISEDAFLYVFSEKFNDLNILKISHFIKQYTVYNKSDQKVIFDLHNLIRKFIEEKSRKIYSDVELRITGFYIDFVRDAIEKLENGDYGIHVQVIDSILKNKQNDLEMALNRINDEELKSKYLDKLSVILTKLRYLSLSHKIRLQCINLDYAASNFNYLADDYRGISSNHLSFSEFDKAIEFGEMALSTYILLGDNYKIATQLVNLGNIYLRSGNISQAEMYIGMIDSIYPERRDDKFNTIFYSCKAALYSKKGDYDNALEYYILGKQLAERRGRIDEVANDTRNIGLCYRCKGRYDLAEIFFKESLASSLSIDDVVGAQRAYKSLSKIPTAEGKKYYEDKINETEIEIQKRGLSFTYMDEII